jgi:uncharacterized protein YjbI with pentapeptide repeats
LDQTDDYKIIIDEPARDVPDFKEHAERLSKIIVGSKPQFTVGIFGGWGTGKTTMMQMINDVIKNSYSDTVTTIWFDSWRYEREKYSLMIPLLRTIILTLHEVINSSGDKKKETLKRVQSGFVKMIKAVAAGAGVNLGAEAGTSGGKISAGLTLDFGKILDEYKSEGHVYVNQEKTPFHKHVSDYLKEELDLIKNTHRPVIFIDDLDRCTPDGALEILESIKTFDIEGIIYVIGMDPSTIDSIIQVKYGKSPKISGLDYMQKIVQLPFQIPVWSGEDLGRTIIKIANETGLPKDITDMMLKQEIKDLIVNCAKLNPRNIKRFINSLVLSYSSSGKNIEDIYNENLRNYILENYLRSMIAIQTFYFRGEKWLRFLKMINNYRERMEFLTHFITVVKHEKISYQDLQNKIKDFPSRTLKIYNEIIEINDEELFAFLEEASISLLKIDKIENYLRAVDSKNIDTTTNIKITSYESIDKLRNGVECFNEYVQGSIIHLPYLDFYEIFNNQAVNLTAADLSGANLTAADLSGANLLGAYLLGAYLSGANLLGVNLSRANLRAAYLSGANLPTADLSGANLPTADLSGNNLSGANLPTADLSKANLSGANLSGAHLPTANLYGANLSGANLLYADLSDANLSNANLSEADLSGADLSGANLLYADLSDANLSEADLSGADLSGADLSRANLSEARISSSILIGIEPQNYESMRLNTKSNFKDAICDNVDFIYYISNFTENIPNIVNDKKELKLKLERKGFQKQEIESISEISKLPD